MTTIQLNHISDQDIASFQEKILFFYKKNKRQLPWRNTTNPYHILLSETMLQQTQVPRVIDYFHRWIQQWPSIHDLAQAPRTEVIKAWMGLGYNNRAIRLHQTAHIISKQYQGDVLLALNEYNKLPGIGPYTATAIRIFAANEDQVTVDTNIRRIFIHEFHLSESVSDKDLWALAQRCLPKGKSRDWHNALMDYGSLVLTSRKTKISPKTKQSRFEGSDRQLRGNILRVVLEKPMAFTDLDELLEVQKQRLQKILDQLQQDGVLQEQHGIYSIKES